MVGGKTENEECKMKIAKCKVQNVKIEMGKDVWSKAKD